MPSFAFIFRFLLPPLLYISPFIYPRRFYYPLVPSLLLARAIWLFFYLSRFVYCHLALNVAYYPFSIFSPANPCFISNLSSVLTLIPLMALIPSNPYISHFLRTLEVSCSRISAILNRTDGSRWFSEGSQKSSRKRRIAEIRDIFHCRWTWVW